MRIESIRLQGLRQPDGEQRLDVGPGYSLVVVSDPSVAAALRAVLAASLYPHSCARALAPWLKVADSGDPARVATTSVTLRAAGAAGGSAEGVLRVLCEPTQQRVHLGRLDTRARGWRRVASESGRIEAGLHRLGLPAADVLFEERGFGWSAGSSCVPAESGLRANLERELERAVEARRILAPLERRLQELRAARRDRDELERETEAELVDDEGLSSLSSRLEKLDGVRERVECYRRDLAKRDRERDQVGRLRLALLETRARLRVIPAAQRPWMGLGLALAAAGAAAARVVGAWLGLFGLAGLALLGLGLWRSEAARRRLDGLDRRLATLRVRERVVEREFESESVGVRGLLATLGVDSTEALVHEADRLEQLREKLEPLHERQARARALFSDSAATELAELEQQASELERGPSERELEARLAELPDDPAEPSELRAPDPGEPRPDAFAAVVSLYLRSLSRGRVRSARPGARGWCFLDDDGKELVLDPIPAPLVLALRLAGIEVAARESAVTVPLLVGPALPDLAPGEREALARALRRLGRVVQVLQISEEEEPWKARADRVVTLGNAPRPE